MSAYNQLPVDRPWRILVACEYSGRIREAMRARGHEAWSCDLLPAEDNSPFHWQGDMFEVLEKAGPWDLLIAHPPCTYLTCSAEWCYRDVELQTKKMKPGVLYGAERRAARQEGVEFVQRIWAADVPRIAIENPVGVLSRHIGEAAQIIQPWWFGDDASKATCLWLKGLPPLQATKIIPGRLVTLPSGKQVERWANQTDSGQNRLAPSEDRWKERSRTYQGIADAIAAQWTPLAPAVLTNLR